MYNLQIHAWFSFDIVIPFLLSKSLRDFVKISGLPVYSLWTGDGTTKVYVWIRWDAAYWSDHSTSSAEKLKTELSGGLSAHRRTAPLPNGRERNSEVRMCWWGTGGQHSWSTCSPNCASRTLPGSCLNLKRFKSVRQNTNPLSEEPKKPA